MKNELPRLADAKLTAAMTLMQRALQLLDETEVAADIGAHLDLAIMRLGEATSQASSNRAENELSSPTPMTPSRSTG